MGYAVTQATVSRDLEQLGAMKVRRDGRLGYALPEASGAPGVPASRPSFAIGRARSRSPATSSSSRRRRDPGHLIGVALDEAKLAGVVGTICGDDTIFVATPAAGEAGRVAAQLDAMRSGQA